MLSKAEILHAILDDRIKAIYRGNQRLEIVQVPELPADLQVRLAAEEPEYFEALKHMRDRGIPLGINGMKKLAAVLKVFIA